MLTRIREKLSTWVIALLLLFIAIPLVFMGLGNYQSATDSYAFKINDQVITTSQLEQEVFQYRQALEKNTQGSLPPFYTNKFIRNITMDYMLRTIILDNTAKNIGLVFHNQSILNNIYNTSSFRDESGFNKDKYKSQLYRIGMTAQSYEGYVYQKGITEQLKNAITDTSIITSQERIDLIKFRHHSRNVSYKIIKFDDIKKSISIKDNDTKDYYEKNKSSYMSAAFARYEYIDIDKNEIIKNIPITDEIIRNIYKSNLENGDYSKPVTYEINHLLINNKSSEAKNDIRKAYDDLNAGQSFEDVVSLYSNDDDTLENKGYLGSFFASDLPEYLSSVVTSLDEGQLSNIIESEKGYHLVKVINKVTDDIVTLNDQKSSITADYKKEKGTRKYFDLIDGIEERNFTKQNTITDISDEFNIGLLTSKYINQNEGYGIFNFNSVRNQVFTNEVIRMNQTSDLIFINEDRFIVAQLLSYKKPEQLSYEESKDIIKALLLSQKTQQSAKDISKNIRDDLNAGLTELDSSYKQFLGTMDSEDISNELKDAFFATSSETGFIMTEFGKDYLIFSVSNVVYPKDIDKLDNMNDYYNFVLNTRSESEFNLFYNNISSELDVVINKDYMDRD